MAESGRERKHVVISFPIERSFVAQIENTLGIRDDDPLGRRFRVSTEHTVGGIALPEARHDEIIELLQAIVTAHRFGSAQEQVTGGVITLGGHLRNGETHGHRNQKLRTA